MSFEAEMIIPAEGVDELGQRAKASSTLLRYSLALIYLEENAQNVSNPLQIKSEELSYIKIEDADTHILFDKNIKWLKSAVHGRRTVKFIET